MFKCPVENEVARVYLPKIFKYSNYLPLHIFLKSESQRVFKSAGFWAHLKFHESESLGLEPENQKF